MAVRFCGAIPMAALLTACSFSSAPTVSPSAMPAPVDRIPRKVILFVPAEFSEYVYQGSQDGRKFRYAFGQGGTAAIIELLSGSFDSVEVRHVPSEAVFYTAISGDTSASSGFDYLAMPKFVGVGNYVVTFKGQIAEAGIKIDFVSRDRAKALSVEGQGHGSNIAYIGAAVRRAGSNALKEAILALRADLDKKRSLF